jgi:hypothetical protein
MSSPFLPIQIPNDGKITMMLCYNRNDRINIKMETVEVNDTTSPSFNTIEEAEDYILNQAQDRGFIDIPDKTQLPITLNLAINSIMNKIAYTARRIPGNIILMNDKTYQEVYSEKNTSFFTFVTPKTIGRWTQVAGTRTDNKYVYTSPLLEPNTVYVTYFGYAAFEGAGVLSKNGTGYRLTVPPDIESLTNTVSNVVQKFNF